MNVLLVNDVPCELEQQRRLIHKSCPHWQLFIAVDYTNALKLTSTAYIDLALLNINSPDADIAAARKLLHAGQVKDIIIVTAHQDFAIAYAAIKLGAVDFLVKPLTIDDLRTINAKYQTAAASKPKYSPLVAKVIAILECHYVEQLSLDKVADAVHVNPSYLSRRFKTEVGVTFSRYLMQIRLQVAKDLLITRHDLSIAQIATQAGFANQQYLSTLFHRLTGLTPREYRRHNHKRC